MKKIWSIFAIILGVTLSMNAQAGLQGQRKNLACALRLGGECEKVSVFLRDLRDGCADTESHCRRDFCRQNCALPMQQSILPETEALCAQNCGNVDVMDHKAQALLYERYKDQGALTEEQAKARYSDTTSLTQRNLTESRRYSLAYSNEIAQLVRAAEDRLTSLRNFRYFSSTALLWKEDLKNLNVFYEQTILALKNHGFTDEEIANILKEVNEQAVTILKTPAQELTPNRWRTARSIKLAPDNPAMAPDPSLANMPLEDAIKSLIM